MTLPGRIFLIGSTGMLGCAFKSRLSDCEVTCISARASSGQTLGHLRRAIAELRPSLVLNCAADTDVEGAESAPQRAFEANALLPEILAQSCRTVGAKLVHFSSTGCYGAYKNEPYGDYDDLKPTTTHHRSKAAGERAVHDAGCESLILRLGWLYGGVAGLKKNFVWARIREAEGKPKLASDPHQIGCPTHVEDVVSQTLRLLQEDLGGTFNCVAEGRTSRFGYVQKILKAAGLTTSLVERSFERRAEVSPNEAAVNEKLELLDLNAMPPWDVALDQYVRRLVAS